MAKRDSDVLVVGAGPVGLFSALLLATRGIKVRIIEEQWRAAARSYALALHPRSLSLLREVGLVDDLIQRGHRIESVAFYDREGRKKEVRLADLRLVFPFVLVIPQQALEEVLAQRLRSEGVPVLWNHRLTALETGSDRCRSRVEKLAKESTGYAVARTEWVVESTQEIHSRFVLGCDGHRSTVRRCLGIEFQVLGTRKQYAVFEFEAGGPDTSEMAVSVHGETTNILWPMRNGRFRWSFELTGEETTEPRVKRRLFVQIHDPEFPYAGLDSLKRFIEQRAVWFDREIREIAWSASVSFERGLADKFSQDRCHLLGDAAHLVWPAAVRSMNVGLQEALEVSRVLEQIIRGGRPESQLHDLGWSQRERWKQLMELDDLEAQPGIDPWVRSYVKKLPSAIPVSGKDLELILETLGIRRPAGPQGTLGES